MRRHGNAGEVLRDRVEEGARAVGDQLEQTYDRVRDRAIDFRDRATDMGGRAVGFAKEHPLATVGSVVAGIGIGLMIARLFRD